MKYFIPPVILRSGKKACSHIRYLKRKFICKNAYKYYAEQYPQKVLFIAGLPKSGTTWLGNMVCSYPGINNILIPEITSYELNNNGSHHYELPENFPNRFNAILALMKMHIPGTNHNAQILQECKVHYVIMYRDLRDVAVSHYFYVKRTPWHPEFPVYRKLNVEQGLKYFAENTLEDFEEWIRSWHRNRDPQHSIVVTYEQLLGDTVASFTRVAKHFELDSSPETISKIVEANSFENLSGGRQHGQESSGSFFRSGTSGNWKNYFTPKVKELYKQKMGDFLIEFGYEKDKSW